MSQRVPVLDNFQSSKSSDLRFCAFQHIMAVSVSGLDSS